MEVATNAAFVGADVAGGDCRGRVAGRNGQNLFGSLLDNTSIIRAYI